MEDAPRLATLCPHTDRPEKAKGRCGSCYNAFVKSEKAAKDAAATIASKSGPAPNDEGDDNELGLPETIKDDELAKALFEKILWEWIFEGEKVATKPVDMDPRDWVRLKEVTAGKAQKAASILGRKFIVEKKEIVQPQALPVAGLEGAAQGWLAVAALSHGKKLNASDVIDGDEIEETDENEVDEDA